MVIERRFDIDHHDGNGEIGHDDEDTGDGEEIMTMLMMIEFLLGVRPSTKQPKPRTAL